VSMPLYRHGQPLWRCECARVSVCVIVCVLAMAGIFYGQLSGMVEPVGGLLGAFAGAYAWHVRVVMTPVPCCMCARAVVLVEPILPYALSFAAGAMIFVVIDR
jgi:zinc transporter ZupT